MSARSQVQTLEGNFSIAEGTRFAIIASRFNAFVVEHLVEGAIDALLRHGAKPENLQVIKVPGSWEIPLTCQQVARRGDVAAIIALGAVIRGATPHFDYVCSQAAKGISQVSLDTGVPIAFGVLTTDTIEQAVERSGTKAGNKGYDAAMVAIEMVSLGRVLTG